MGTYRQSASAHRLCIGSGLEIGAAAHNPFGLDTLNVDYTREETEYSNTQFEMCGRVARVDVVSPGDDLPFPDKSLDFVVSSHVLEHFADPIGALLEWDRVVRHGGVIYFIVPNKDRTFDRGRESTPLEWLIESHELGHALDDTWKEHHPWTAPDIIEMLEWIGEHEDVDWTLVEFLPRDDKVGNGMAFCLRKR